MDTNKLISEIEKFNKKRIQDSNFSHLVDAGLNVFSFSDKILFSSFYLLNEEDFIFNHYNTIPNKYIDDSKSLYNQLVGKGIIGQTLTNVEIVNDYKNTYLDNKYHCFLIPIIKSQGILGLIFFTYISNVEIDKSIFNNLNLFSHYFAGVLENAINLKKLEKNKEIFDQQVAYRTMKLVEAQKNLADKFDYLRSSLTMSIPHEVRTPINQILGFSDFLMKYYKTTEQEEAIEMLTDIHDSAIRLKELFENYIYYANLSIVSTNVYEIMKLQQLVTPDLSALIKDSAYALSENFGRKDDIKIDIQFEECALAISEEYVKKTIDEILSNSCKYSEKGTPIEIKVRKIDKKDIGEMCEITITDYGKGMPPEQVKNIDAYMQFDRKIQEQQGSGLGLSIVQRIIDLHNGFIDIKSEIGKFTTIIIQFPLANLNQE